MLRFGLVAERVDVDTEIYVSMAREHMEIPVWRGNEEALVTYSQDVGLLLLATRSECRALLGPRSTVKLGDEAQWGDRSRR